MKIIRDAQGLVCEGENCDKVVTHATFEDLLVCADHQQLRVNERIYRA